MKQRQHTDIYKKTRKQLEQENCALQTLAELDIQNAAVTLVDKGALDCVIRARVKACAYRACECESYQWGGGAR